MLLSLAHHMQMASQHLLWQIHLQGRNTVLSRHSCSSIFLDLHSPATIYCHYVKAYRVVDIVTKNGSPIINFRILYGSAECFVGFITVEDEDLGKPIRGVAEPCRKDSRCSLSRHRAVSRNSENLSVYR